MYKNLNLGAIGHGGLPFDRACALATTYNFPGIDLDLGYLGALAKDKSLSAAKDWFASTRLRPGAIGLSAKWRETDADADFDASMAAFADEVKLAAAFGCTRCATWVLPFSKTRDFYQHWDVTAPRLQKVAQVLADHGLSLGMEFIGPATLRANQTHDFVHTMDGMRAYAAAVGASTRNVGLLLDCWHWYTAHASVRDLEFLTPRDVVYVHVNDAPKGRAVDEQLDNQREMVGATGVIDIKGFFNALKKIGYDGPVTVEPFNQAVREMPVEEAVKFTGASLDRVM
jgi:sugar phosphate isomerase/epimerase